MSEPVADARIEIVSMKPVTCRIGRVDPCNNSLDVRRFGSPPGSCLSSSRAADPPDWTACRLDRASPWSA